MKIKIEIKNRFTGKILFEFEKENNTIKETLIEAIKKGAYLQGADLQGADLQGADLRGAYLRGADLQGKKIKYAVVFIGLYKYTVIPYITEKDEKRIKLGCHDRSLTEWENNFWNNPKEFPNDGDENSLLRLMAFETAKRWLEIKTK